MRIETTTRTLYTFDELPEENKQKTIEKLWDINVDFEWWDFTYDDAESIGLKISEFDLDRTSYVKGAFLQSAMDVAKAIIEGHGPDTDTYKLAEQYLQDRKEMQDIFMIRDCQDDADLLQWPGSLRDWDTIIEYEPESIDEDAFEGIDVDFERALKEEYASILQQEYDYLTSEEAIIETIKANEYEFDEEGNLA